MPKIVSGSLTCCDMGCSKPASSLKAIRELRDLMRARSNLVQERARQINRVQKVLETANIKLASAVTDILDKSSRQMIEALLDGQTHPIALVQLARFRLRSKIRQLSLAFDWSGERAVHFRRNRESSVKRVHDANELAEARS